MGDVTGAWLASAPLSPSLWTSEPGLFAEGSGAGGVQTAKASRMLDDLKVTGEGNGKPLQYSCLENPMNSMKRPKDMTLKDELPRLIGAQYATGDQWSYNTRKNEEMEPK